MAKFSRRKVRKDSSLSRRSARSRLGSRLNLEKLEPRQLLSVNVTTYHMDNQSTGVNNNETQLTLGNVNTNSFGKTFQTPVDGQVYGEPLYVANVNVTVGNFQGVHNVVYAVTENDSLYAIDSVGGNILWQDSFLNSSLPGVAVAGATSITAIPNGDTGSSDINPLIGITGTPVIDTSQNALFTMANTKQLVTVNGTTHTEYVEVLFKINLQTGAVMGSNMFAVTDTTNGFTYRTNNDPSNTNQDPFVFGHGDGSITVNGQSRVYFNALRQMSRPGMELVAGQGGADNQIYTFWASHGDNGPYHGWVLRFDENTLAITAALNTTPNGGLGGIWQGGDIAPMDLDANGQPRFFAETGNGTFDGNNSSGTVTGLNAQGFPVNGDYGDSFIAISQDTTTTQANQNQNGWGLKVSDYFAPQNNQSLNSGDTDLGSGGPVILPDALGQIQTSGPRAGLNQQLLIGGGKEGKLYLIDRNNMGKFSTTDNVVEESKVISGHLNSPTYFNNEIYVVPGYGGSAVEMSIANGSSHFSTTPVSSSYGFGSLDGSPTLSANNGSNAILWAEDRGQNTLVAFNATTMATLWTSNQDASRDAIPGGINKFAVPTVANGQVFVGAAGYLVAYGPPVVPTSGPAAPTSLSGNAPYFNTVNLSWTDNSNNEDYFSIQRSTSSTGPFVEVGEASANAQTFTDTYQLQSQTTYYYQVEAHNSFGGGTYSAPTNVTSVTTPQAPPTGTGDGLAAKFWNDAGDGTHQVGSPVATTVLTTINYPSNSNSIFNGVNATYFSALITGRVQAQFSETYTFTTFSDDGVQLYIKPTTSSTWTTLINDYNDHGTTQDNATYTMSGGQQYDIMMNFYQGGGPWQLNLDWSSAHTPMETIPQSQLYSGTAPPVPSGLSATASSGTTVALSWSENSTLETGFTIVRTNPDNSQTSINVPANTATYMDSGLAPGSTYNYQIQADNFAANSALTASAPVLMPVIPLPPQNVTTSNVTTNSITVSWQIESNTPADEPIYIAVSRRLGDGTYAEIAQVGPTVTSYTDNTAAPGTHYDYHIQAGNAAGFSDHSGANTDTLTLAPTSLSATPGVGLISLSWTGPATLPTDYSYSVYRGTIAGQENSTPIGSGITTTTFTDSSATPGQPYFYIVRVVDGGGASAASNEVNSTSASSNVPNPASLSATLNGTTAHLSWSSVGTATSYKIYRGTGSGGEGTTAIATVTSGLTYNDPNRQAGVSYFYQVTAVNSSGESARSPEASVILAPAAPTSVVASIEPQDRQDIYLDWTAPTGATSYNIYRSSTPGGEGNTPYATMGAGSEFIDTDAAETAGANYYYKIVAINAGGSSPISAEAFVAVPPAAPGAPSTSIRAAGNVALSWSATSGALTYNVYRATTSGNEGTVAIATGLSSPNYVDSNVAAGGTFYYEVTAVGAGGESTKSTESSISFTTGTPKGPANFVATVNSFNKITLNWTASNGATGYNIFRGTSPGGEGSTPINSSPVTVTAFVDTPLTDNVTYYYTVRAINTNGAGPAATEATGHTPQQIPTATITPLNPSTVTTGPGTMTIVFNEPVSGFTTSSLSLSRGGSPNLLTTAQTLSTTDNTTYTLSGLSSVDTAGGAYTLTFTAAGSGVLDSRNTSAVSNASTSFTVSPTVPQVTGVYVRTDGWQSTFKNYLAANGLGSSTLGFSIPGGSGQLTTIPWSVNVIEVQFNTDVNVTASSITLAGSPGGNTVVPLNDPTTTFSYNSTTHVATWDFRKGLLLNKYLLSIPTASVTSKANGQTLDGEWTNGVSYFDSGNGTAGGDFNFRFNVLPGDVDRLGTVTQQEVTDLKAHYLIYFNQPGYNPFMDSTGKGFITGIDLTPVQSNLGATLPSAEPLTAGQFAALSSVATTSQPAVASTTTSGSGSSTTTASSASTPTTLGTLTVGAGQTLTLAPVIAPTATTTAGASPTTSSTAADAVFDDLGSQSSAISKLLQLRLSLLSK